MRIKENGVYWFCILGKAIVALKFSIIEKELKEALLKPLEMKYHGETA